MNARGHAHPIRPAACAALAATLLLTTAQPAAAQPGWVLSHQRISDTQGGFSGIPDDDDWFGAEAASLGDLDGDGVPCDLCDMNCDAEVNAFDIEPFLDLLFGGAEPCNFCNADVNGDGNIDAFEGVASFRGKGKLLGDNGGLLAVLCG